MDESWVTTTLGAEIDILPALDGNGNPVVQQMLVVGRDAQGTPQQAVSPAAFASMFATAATPITADSLNAIDGGTLGYAAAIAEWQSKGYIS